MKQFIKWIKKGIDNLFLNNSPHWEEEKIIREVERENAREYEYLVKSQGTFNLHPRADPLKHVWYKIDDNNWLCRYCGQHVERVYK